MHQSAPNFATSRGAQMFTDEIEKATDGALKVRRHLAGTLQINASNITQAVGENVVQIGDDLFNLRQYPGRRIPRLPMLIQSYDDFAKADAALKPYFEKSFGQKGVTMLASYTYPLQSSGAAKNRLARRHQRPEASRCAARARRVRSALRRHFDHA